MTEIDLADRLPRRLTRRLVSMGVAGALALTGGGRLTCSF